MITTLILTGSPRKNGNTDILTALLVDKLEKNKIKVQQQHLADMNIHPCLGCGGCEKDGNCIINDDMQTIYPRIAGADKIIIASPIYFYGLTAQTKTCVDRCQALWSQKYILKQQISSNKRRKGYLICVAATRGERVFEGAKLCTRYVFDAMDVSYAGDLFYPGIDAKGAISDHPDFMDKLNTFIQILLKDV